MNFADIENKNSVIEKKLDEFNYMEIFFRDYYFMQKNLKTFTAEECNLMDQRYKEFTFLTSPGIDTLDEGYFIQNADINIMKHCRYLPGKLHIHHFIELFYVYRGSCIHVCNQKNYHLTEGDFCFWQFDAPHMILSNSDEFLALNIFIKRDAFEKMFFPLLKCQSIISYYFQNILFGNHSHPMIIFRTGKDQIFKNHIANIYEEAFNKKEYYLEMITNYLCEALIYLLREHLSHVITRTSKKEESATSILRYIQEHYNTANLSDICRHFNYSSSYLSRLIKKNFGMTYSQIIKNQRLERAKWLLEHTDMSISNIALETGCVDSSHLYRIFKQECGITPLKYRVLTSKKDEDITLI